jgi:hypothetical protein
MMRRAVCSASILASTLVGCTPTQSDQLEWSFDTGLTIEYVTSDGPVPPACETAPSCPVRHPDIGDGAVGAYPIGFGPLTEDCFTEADENGDGEGMCKGIPISIRSYGNAYEQYPLDIAMDAKGNSVIVGGFEGTINFGDGELASAGFRDIFVVKFNDRGEVLWSRSFGDEQYQQAQRVALDDAGNVFVTGHFKGSLDFGSGPLVGKGFRDAFLLKLDSSGAHVWSKRFGDAAEQYGRGVATDSDGNVYVAGATTGTIDLGNGPLTSAGWEDIFIAKLDGDGFPLWSKLFGDAATQDVWDMATDSEGNAIFTGFMQGTVDFGDGAPEVATGQPDALLVKLDPSGDLVWSKTGAGYGLQYGQSVAVDRDDNIIMTGAFKSEIKIDGNVMYAAGPSDVFITRFSPSGLLNWNARFGDGDEQFSLIASTDRENNILVTGSFMGSISFGGDTLSSEGSFDTFAAKLDPLGDHLWSRRFGDGDYQEGSGIAADQLGNVQLLGLFSGTISFGEASIYSSTPVSIDLFVGTLSP